MVRSLCLDLKCVSSKKRKLALLVFATDLETHSLAALSQLSKISSRFHSDVSVIRAISREGQRSWGAKPAAERDTGEIRSSGGLRPKER